MPLDPFGFHIVGGWPEIDAGAMAEIDRLMIETLGITLPQMMENAGRSLAVVARDRFLQGNVAARTVTVLAGAGGNGGGALACARRLAGWGARVSVVLAGSVEAMAPVPVQQLGILAKMGLVPTETPPQSQDLIIDGLIGYSLRGTPRGRALELIQWANGSGAPVLSLDVPSGFDTQIGVPSQAVIEAKATLTLALPKLGLQFGDVRHVVGDLYLADISVPPALYQCLVPPCMVPPFSVADVMRLPT